MNRVFSTMQADGEVTRGVGKMFSFTMAIGVNKRGLM